MDIEKYLTQEIYNYFKDNFYKYIQDSQLDGYYPPFKEAFDGWLELIDDDSLDYAVSMLFIPKFDISKEDIISILDGKLFKDYIKDIMMTEDIENDPDIRKILYNWQELNEEIENVSDEDVRTVKEEIAKQSIGSDNVDVTSCTDEELDKIIASNIKVDECIKPSIEANNDYIFESISKRFNVKPSEAKDMYDTWFKEAKLSMDFKDKIDILNDDGPIDLYESDFTKKQIDDILIACDPEAVEAPERVEPEKVTTGKDHCDDLKNETGDKIKEKFQLTNDLEESKTIYEKYKESKLNEKLIDLDFERLNKEMEEDSKFKEFMNTPLTELPENYRYLLDDNDFNNLKDGTLYELVAFTCKMSNDFKVFVSDDDKLIGWIAYRIAGNSVVYGIKMFSFNREDNDNIVFMKDIKDKLKELVDNYRIVIWSANKNNPFIKYYYKAIKQYNGTANENGDTVEFMIESDKEQSLVKSK